MHDQLGALQGGTGKRWLVTTSEWFHAPDGNSYRAVYGTVHGVLSDERALGIKTNARSTNWYLSIGRMVVAGCQIHYAMQADECSREPPLMEMEHEGVLHATRAALTRIWFAD